MTAIYPLAAFGARNLQALRPVHPVTPVVRGSASAIAEAPAANQRDKVTLGGNSPRTGDGLYSRKGTLVSSMERQQSFDLRIQTAEGDTATLRFSQSMGSRSAIKTQDSPSGSRVESLQESYGALDLQIQVRGALSDEETLAMNQLVQQASAVADQFFAGNDAAATAQAGALQLEGDVLQAFSMDLRSQEMRRVSATYEEVARYTAPSSAQQPTPSPLLQAPSSALPGTDLLQGLKQLFAKLVSDMQDTKTVTDVTDKTALA